MLKPKYKTVAELVGDFNDNIRYLDSRLPKDATLAKPEVPAEKPKLQTESVDKPQPKAKVQAEAAWLSQYSSEKKAMDSFRVLAGLEEREIMPWNPGIVGETRSVQLMMEDFGMVDVEEVEETTEVAEDEQHPYYSPKAVHKALSQSHRVLSSQHAHHSYMGELDDKAKAHVKGRLAKHTAHVAYTLRGLADHAPRPIADKLHALAQRHERHSKIYASGGRPKLEAIEEMQSVIENIDPMEYFDIAQR